MPKKVGKIKEQKEKKSYKIYGVRREEELNRLEKDDLPEPLENLLKVGGGCLNDKQHLQAVARQIF